MDCSTIHSLDPLQVAAALVAQQALVMLEAWQHVDGIPEAGPAAEFAGSHVGGDQAGGGASDFVGIHADFVHASTLQIRRINIIA